MGFLDKDSEYYRDREQEYKDRARDQEFRDHGREHDPREEAERLMQRNPYIRRMIDDARGNAYYFRQKNTDLENEVKALKKLLEKYEKNPKNRGIKIADELNIV